MDIQKSFEKLQSLKAESLEQYNRMYDDRLSFTEKFDSELRYEKLQRETSVLYRDLNSGIKVIDTNGYLVRII